jgi:hypothetical protein
VTRFLEEASLLRQGVFVGTDICLVLGGHLLVKGWRVAFAPLEPRAGKLGVDPAQRHPAVLILRSDRVHVGERRDGVHANQNLPLLHSLALAHQNLPDDAVLGCLKNLQVTRRNELAFSHRNDVELPEVSPRSDRCYKREQEA